MYLSVVRSNNVMSLTGFWSIDELRVSTNGFLNPFTCLSWYYRSYHLALEILSVKVL